MLVEGGMQLREKAWSCGRFRMMLVLGVGTMKSKIETC